MSLNLLENIKEIDKDLFEMIISEKNIGLSILRAYQGKGSNIINENLLQNNSSFLFVEALLNNCLDNEFQKYKGDTLYRNDGVLNTKFSVNWFKENLNQVICFPSFVSTSKQIENLGIRERYFKIKPLTENTHAFDTSYFSKTLENEVLFKSKTSFRIISINGEIVELQETKEKPDITLYKDTGCYNPKFREGFQEVDKNKSLSDEYDI
jgi:hypothetical protein